MYPYGPSKKFWRLETKYRQSILDAEADYLLAVKDNQPTLHAEIRSYFETAPSDEVVQVETIGKDHGRIEIRTHTVSHAVDWIDSQRSYPGAPRFPKITAMKWNHDGETYDDLIRLAQRYVKQSYVTHDKETARELWLMAREYQERVAKLDGGRLPDIGSPPIGIADSYSYTGSRPLAGAK